LTPVNRADGLTWIASGTAERNPRDGGEPMAAAKPWADYADLGLFTDLYELTMLQAYVERGMAETATFSLFVRRLPERRNYLLACGLDDVLRYFESLRFTREGLDYLASLGRFTDRFLQWLEGFRFTGDVDAVPEGTPRL
jgi:nicotinate phosphoribosyltransferase